MSQVEPSQLAPAADWSVGNAASTLRDPPSGQRFARHHRWDRNFFLVYVVLIWVAILSGFAPQVIKHVNTHAPAYPPIVHIHAAVFVGWLLLLTVQVLLIRSARVGLHRALGIVGVVLATAMIVIGPTTAIIVDRLRLALPNPDPGFVAVQMLDILAFAGLVIPAFVLRKDSSVHKRLILLATVYITDAGFDRWLGSSMETLVGDGFWGNAAQLYLGVDLLVLGVGVYDWVTRRRLHGAYIGAVAWIVAMQATALFLYTSPGWGPVALRLLKH
jgi:hypothetical protein